jgi:hypothetical protein
MLFGYALSLKAFCIPVNILRKWLIKTEQHWEFGAKIGLILTDLPEIRACQK